MRTGDTHAVSLTFVTVKITTYNVEYLRLLKQNLTVSDKWDRQCAAAVVLRDVKFDARICRRAHLRVMGRHGIKSFKTNFCCVSLKGKSSFSITYKAAVHTGNIASIYACSIAGSTFFVCSRSADDSRATVCSLCVICRVVRNDLRSVGLVVQYDTIQYDKYTIFKTLH